MQFDGVLFFPVTPFDADDRVATGPLAEHVSAGVESGAAAVFAACGTGEFHALDAEDYAAVVSTAARAAGGRVPVFAGAGGSLPLALAAVRTAEESGADGILLLPPYLVSAPVDGLTSYVRAVAAATHLKVIVYQRANATFSPRAVAELMRLPNVVGFKDGLGDFDLMQRIVLTVRRETGRDPAFFNGLPTAELTVPAYRAIGVPLYSSAVFAFAPEISLAFYDAVTGGDGPAVRLLLTRFFLRFVELRDRVPGYAVSLVKAGARLGGLEVGGVRPPLVDPTPDDLAELEQVIADGHAAVREFQSGAVLP